MNRIQESMKNIRASEELKRHTMEYLLREQLKRRRRMQRYALLAACFCLFLAAGGYTLYVRPVSYISIDVNPSIELGINCFGHVVTEEAYNEEGRDILRQVKLKRISYIQALERLLGDNRYLPFLKKDSKVYVTVISKNSEAIIDKIDADRNLRKYEALTYTSDMECRKEAHEHDMSFGKYRASMELTQYDETVTVEDCHGMSMREITDRIEKCKGHGERQETEEIKEKKETDETEGYQYRKHEKSPDNSRNHGSHGKHYRHGH